jgi:hypothetical protein
MKRVYIAGKITGDADYQRKFGRAEAQLEAAGYAVANPARLPNSGFTWEACMRMSTAMLEECDAVCLLPDWQNSKGARIERAKAQAAGKKVILFGEAVRK